MLSSETRRTVSEVVKAVLSVRPLVDVLERPVQVGCAATDQSTVEQVIDRITGRLGVPPFSLVDPERLQPFEQVISKRIGVDRLSPLGAQALAAVEEVADHVVATDFSQFCERVVTSAPDGALIPAYAAGDPAAPAVVIASACGMPVRLTEPWIRRLAESYRVITWESRGLFGTAPQFDEATDVAAQVVDLCSVMDCFGVSRAHVVGLCGGAVLALVAAHEHPDRVSSMSLWHGDFELGDSLLKTDHQRNLQALMAMAARDRDSARGIQATLCQAMLASTPPGLAHLVLYPYATPELLYRYCGLNGAIMNLDVSARLAEVGQPALVVTSEDDHTAHPAGSRYVASKLARGSLIVTPHGDHLSLFEGSAVLDIAVDFIAGQVPVAGRAHS